MKKIYLSTIRPTLSIFFTLVLAGLTQWGNAQFPVPDQAFAFDDSDTAYHTTVTDTSGNHNNGYWWAYREGQDKMYAKYNPDGGVFGGSWHISGYHICCEEMASPSMDFILLAGNHDENKDVEGFKGDSPVYHEGFNSLSVAFWFKSDRDYTKEHTPCPPEENGMHEQEILFSLGSGNALAINNFKGYYEVRIGYQPEGGTAETKAITYLYVGEGAVNKTWQHIAITWDGENNGALTVYLDGEIAKTYLGDPNPLETGFTQLLPTSSSTEIGAQNNGGLFGNVSAFWGTGNIGQYCITAADTTYRTGWPASGDYDDYVFYKNKVLTQAEIQQLMNNGIVTMLYGEPGNVPPTRVMKYNIFPNPSGGTFRVQSSKSEQISVKVYSVLGNLVWQKQNARTNQELNVSGLNKGIYFIQVNEQFTSKLLLK